MGQERKGELKPRISAICKISFQSFGKSPSEKRTREHSTNKGLSFFFIPDYGKSVFISIISYLQHFYWPSASQNCFSLSGVSRRNQYIMFSKTKSYTACNHPWESSLYLILSAEMSKIEKDIKFCSRTCTKLLCIPILAYQDQLNKFCCASTWSNLCQDLLAVSEHIGECIHTIWISNFQNTQRKKTSFIYGTGNNHIMLWRLVIDLIIWSL